MHRKKSLAEKLVAKHTHAISAVMSKLQTDVVGLERRLLEKSLQYHKERAMYHEQN